MNRERFAPDRYPDSVNQPSAADKRGEDLLAAIRAGHHRFAAIADATNLRGVIGERQLDRALQRLRRAGRIEYTKDAGWTVVTQ